MKNSLILLIVVFCAVPYAGAQGILLPDVDRIARLPMPIPGPIPGPHPLAVKRLNVETRIQGQVASTKVTQVFSNDLNSIVDGTYFYPLPENATFVDFAIWDGTKKLRGEVLEKEEARGRYLAIVRRCWDPGLLEYAGTNLFQARVFPVPARGEKRIEFTYNQILKADHGLIAYTYPLQTGIRANPQHIGSIRIAVDIRTEQGLRNVYSPTHTVDLHRDGERSAQLSYEASDALPDRNFQLFYSLSNADFGLSLITFHQAAEDGYFMLLLTPKIEQSTQAILPKDILFVLDTSGSMQERGKLEKALAALKFGIRTLNSGDRFNIIAFSTESRKFRETLVPATSETRTAAFRFIELQTASGGTNIQDALRDALAGLQSGDRPSYVVFLTDGLPSVGETDPGRILREITARNTNTVKSRVFTFGVGYDVNTFLLDQLAARNFGSSDYVTPDEDLEVKLSNFFTKLANPVMAGLELDLGALRAYDLQPRQLPDVFKGSQITVLGRYTGSGTFPVTVRGKTEGRGILLKFEQEFPADATCNDFLPRLWAMRKVGYLLEQIRMSGENSELKNEVIQLAKKYGFVTPYTSYLATDDSELVTRNGMRQPRLTNLQMSAANFGTAPAAEAVAASKVLRTMKSSDVAVSPVSGIRQVGAKSFRLENGAWTDLSYSSGSRLPVVDLAFASDALLTAIASDAQLASYAALGKNVTVVHKNKVYRIRG